MMRRLPEWHWASQSGMNFPDSGLPHDGRYIVWPDTASGNYADLMTCQLHETLQSHRSFDRRRRSSRSALPKDRADSAGPTGFALAGGLSYDARISPWFAISPELFVTWHQVPNLPGIADDVASIYGVRLNLLWYLH